MQRIKLAVFVAVLATATLAGTAAAAEPTRVTLQIPPVTLDDAVAAYEEFGEYAFDCGDFHIITTFAGSVTVTEYGDRMLRQVSYEGGYYNASDLTKSAGRIGRTATWREFDSNGNLTRITIHGLGDQAVLPDGGRISLSAGIRSINFTVDPPVDDFVAGRLLADGLSEQLCDALR